MGVMERLCGWTPEEKAQQLMLALQGDAQMVLLNLAQKEWGDLNTLTAALQRRSLAKLAPDLEWEAQDAYADSHTREQEEQARFQLVEAVSPGELCKHLRLSKLRSLQDALQLAQEWEDISKEEGEHRSQPAVQAVEVEVGPDQSGLRRDLPRTPGR
ncbi:UNVERIFIED_CONTAM: hypothetical protein FKN15_070273 [Acipenser sinensis]